MRKNTFYQLLILKLSFLFIFLSFPLQSSHAQNSLLWKIEGNDLEKPSYLYGTMHSQDKRVHDLGKMALPYLNECDAVALELVIDSAQMLPMMIQLFGDMMMKDTTLQDLYKAETDYQLVKKHVVKELGFVAFAFKIEQIKPMFITLFMEEMKNMNQGFMGKEMGMALDQYFQKVGEMEGKKLIGVETIKEQMNAFNQIPLQEQANMLLDAAKMAENGAKPDSSIYQLMDFYLKQDLDGLMDWYEQEQTYQDTSFDQVILLERNFRMADRMDAILKEQPTFIAVGALHLPGEDGLIKLLTEKGYELSPVEMQPILEEIPVPSPPPPPPIPMEKESELILDKKN